MHSQYTDVVMATLAQHLGVARSELAVTHDLYRDWGLQPLSLVVILLDLERLAAIELPPSELCSVRTVADLIAKFRLWVRSSAPDVQSIARRRARYSRHAQRERRIRRELHHLRWLEHVEP